MTNEEVIGKLQLSVPCEEKGRRSSSLYGPRPESIKGTGKMLLIFPGVFGPWWLEGSPGLLFPTLSVSTATHPTRLCTLLGVDNSATSACHWLAAQSSGDSSLQVSLLVGPDVAESPTHKTSLSVLPQHVCTWPSPYILAICLPTGKSTLTLVRTFHLVVQAFRCFRSSLRHMFSSQTPRISYSHRWCDLP